MEDLILVHSPEYANWVFDPSHPTQGRRFLNGRNKIMLKGQERKLNVYEIEPEIPHTNDLLRVHDELYVEDVVILGLSDEWEGQRHDLGDLAKLFVGGTLTALEQLLDGKTKVAVNLPGAKHHAMKDYSSGFCVFADFAIAAKVAIEAGHKVAIFDCDAHHGDGTEALLKDEPNALTFSVHEWGIFPGTGLSSDWENKAINFPLASETGDTGLLAAVDSFVEAATAFEASIIFVACGADALGIDPLSSLNYSVDGYVRAMKHIREYFPQAPILFGGAGGYTPDTGTPEVWSEAALALV